MHTTTLRYVVHCAHEFEQPWATLCLAGLDIHIQKTLFTYRALVQQYTLQYIIKKIQVVHSGREYIPSLIISHLTFKSEKIYK